MSRWMPVYEDDMTHWLWDQPQRYQWWLEIQFRAAIKQGVRYVGGTNYRVNVKRGEWPVTISYLSEHWHSDDGAIKSFLEALVGDGLITIYKSGLITVLCVVGFERYCFQKQPGQEPYSIQDSLILERNEQGNASRLDYDVGDQTHCEPLLSTETQTNCKSQSETYGDTLTETESYPPTKLNINTTKKEKRIERTSERRIKLVWLCRTKARCAKRIELSNIRNYERNRTFQASYQDLS